MLTALVFVAINIIGYILALLKGPYWGLLVYMNIYFNPPQENINWWGGYVPFDRWSLLTSLILIISIIVNRQKISDHKFSSAKWAFIFLPLSLIITLTKTIDREDALHHTYLLLTYCIIIYIIVKCIKEIWQYRLFSLGIIIMAANLSVKAFLHGKRIHARLENIGTPDTFGSNEFALLLAGIIPLTLPFIINGKWYERIICLLSIPFLFNAFILCNSRGAFVAFIASVILVFTIVSDMKIRKTILISALFAISLFTYLTDNYFIDRISTLLGSYEAMQYEGEAKVLSSGRTEIWKYGFQMVNDHPFGAGPNAFKQLARFYIPFESLTFHHGAEYGIRAAHNTYLQVLVEQGYLGLFIWVMICVHTFYLVYISFQKLKKINLPDTFWKYSLFALHLSFFSILIGGLFTSRVYYEFFWWQIAISVVASSFVGKMESEKIIS